jgi:hypothetical protein
MFSSLTSLFERNFIIGFILPVLIFLLELVFIPSLLDPAIATQVRDRLADAEFVDTVYAAVAVYSFSLILYSLNTQILRTLEGYGLFEYGVFRLVAVYRFKRLSRTIEELREKIRESGREDEKARLLAELEAPYRRLRMLYPHEERFVMAFPLGNVIRSFERYPQKMYGMDSIPIWPRIFAFVPEHMQKAIDRAKAQVDLAANLNFLNLVLLIGYLVGSIVLGYPINLVVVAIVLAVFGISYYVAIMDAMEWGEEVKSVFDICRYKLLEELGIEQPATMDEERDIWVRVSQAMIYWSDMPTQPGGTTGQSSS